MSELMTKKEVTQAYENVLWVMGEKKKDSDVDDLLKITQQAYLAVDESNRKTITQLVKASYKNAKEHGWWDDPRRFGELIALCHSELSETLEEFRNGKEPTEIYYSGTTVSGSHRTMPHKTSLCKKPEGIPIELADVLIRIFDMCGHFEIDLEQAIAEKMEYNKNRPYKHGDKVI